MQQVILRNPDIDYRCYQPELFDRFGRLSSEYMQETPDEVAMLERMSLNY
jgi:hypothetical protein